MMEATELQFNTGWPKAGTREKTSNKTSFQFPGKKKDFYLSLRVRGHSEFPHPDHGHGSGKFQISEGPYAELCAVCTVQSVGFPEQGSLISLKSQKQRYCVSGPPCGGTVFHAL